MLRNVLDVFGSTNTRCEAEGNEERRDKYDQSL